MLTHRRQARDYLNKSTRTDFWEIVNEVKVGDRAKIILDLRFARGWSIAEIARKTGYSEEKIDDVIKEAYDRVANLLGFGGGEIDT